MSEVALASLRELAGPELYRRNAFLVTGLPADVDRRTARQRQQQLTAALRVGADLDRRDSLAAPEDVGAAFDAILGDPRRRLVHEIFAPWGAPDGCECPAAVHDDHDAAVRAHAAALAAPPETISDSWPAAAAAWTRTLGSASFWRHLHHRVARLDDKQLDASTVDALRAELPLALARPLVRLAGSAARPAPLRTHLSEWPVPARDRDRLLDEAAEPLYAELESILQELHATVEAGDADGAVAAMRTRVKPVVARLEGLVPHGQHRRTAVLRDKVAVLLNNCALARYRATGWYDGKVKAWVAEAERLATDPENLRRIRENRESFAALDRFSPVGYRPAPSQGFAERHPRLVGVLVVCALVLGVGYVVYRNVADRPEGRRVNLHQPDYRDNPPPTACVADGDDWRDGDSAATVVDCEEEHWAEVVSYEPLARDAGTGYPGAEQVARLSRFLCLQARDEFGLLSSLYDVEIIAPDQNGWNEADPSANYATCAARRHDDERWGWRAAHASRNQVTFPVLMPLTSREGFLENPPVGFCVQDKEPTPAWDEEQRITRCDRLHWAQILGYPAMAGAATEQEIAANARTICQDLATGLYQLPDGYTVTAAWPRWRGDSPGYTACLAHRADDHLVEGTIQYG
ncbi:hypothetical protein WEI85_35430 [Actinomycetes bacterium KLBMP 9797]